MMESKPLLSICIPIYNRASCLEKMLARFIEERTLFEDSIHLYISDNCSEDNLLQICDRYRAQGLRLEYHRNSSNLGMDGNFVNCFKHAIGKYVLLLGSDDVPLQGSLNFILDVLSQNDFGLLHLSSNNNSGVINSLSSNDELLQKINYWITYISGNIVKTEFVDKIDFAKYDKSLLSQVPLYLEAISKSKVNGIVYRYIYEDNSTVNSGYNPFYVFGVTFVGMLKEYMLKGEISKVTYVIVKRKLLYKYLASRYVKNRLLGIDKMDISHVNEYLRIHYSISERFFMYLHFILVPFDWLLKYSKEKIH